MLVVHRSMKLTSPLTTGVTSKEPQMLGLAFDSGLTR
jgi:hypothetical protein